MFKTFVNVSNIVAEEPTLLEYLENGDIDIANLIDIANEHMINDLTNRSIKIKNICTPLTLVKDTAVEDKIERKRLVVECSATTDTTIVTLKGRNKTTDSYRTLFNDIVINEIGEVNRLITNPYNYYMIEYSNNSSTINAYLIETAFDLPLSRYVLFLAYKRLNLLSGDVYREKADIYKNDYTVLMDNLLYSYNQNGDTEEITQLERKLISFGR